MLSRCYEDMLVGLAGSGSTLLPVEQEDHPDSPGIQEGSHSPSRQNGSAPAHPTKFLFDKRSNFPG
jgi:hypothetical protein